MTQSAKITELKSSIYHIMAWGKVSELKTLLEQNPKLIKTALWQKKAVKMACYYGKVEHLKFLLANKGILEAKYNKYSPIWVFALKHNSIEMLQIMEERNLVNFTDHNFHYVFYYATKNREVMEHLWQNYGATLGIENRDFHNPIYARALATSWLKVALDLFSEPEAQEMKRKIKLVFEQITGSSGQNVVENAFEAGMRQLWERQVDNRKSEKLKTMMAYQWQNRRLKNAILVTALLMQSLDCAEILLTDAEIVKDTKEIFAEKGQEIFGRLKPSLRMVKVIEKIGLDPVETAKYSWLHRKSGQLATTTLRTLKKQHPEWLETTNEQSHDTVWERVPVEKRVGLDKEELLKNIPPENNHESPPAVKMRRL